MDLNQSRTRPGSRWRLPGRGRPRGRHVRGLDLSQEPAPFPAFHACPVMTGEPSTGADASVTEIGRWGLPEHSPSAALLVSAEQFLTLYYTENRLGSPELRIRQVRRDIEATGTYWHTPQELTFGARVAWRNSARCIGRLYWNSLRVRDRREVTAAPDIAEEAATHLREATNGGRIRPMITVFAPDAPGRPGPRIISSQLVRYAGHEIADGVIIGDPANAVLTRIAEAAGWRGGRPVGRFDTLPLLVQAAGGPVTCHDLPADAILEVDIRHPEYDWFAGLGLRWHAVPVISDMYLDIGGVCYPAAPFNGWYMGTEIGSRNLGDSERYNQLPLIAAHLGLTTKHDRNLWKDRALTELNLAVLHSYEAAGVTITDHHTESARFLQHIDREERHGRACPADWSWIVPPAASSATPVFHRYYTDFDQTPNFYRHPAPVAPPPAAPVPSAALQAHGEIAPLPSRIRKARGEIAPIPSAAVDTREDTTPDPAATPNPAPTPQAGREAAIPDPSATPNPSPTPQAGREAAIPDPCSGTQAGRETAAGERVDWAALAREQGLRPSVARELVSHLDVREAPAPSVACELVSRLDLREPVSPLVTGEPAPRQPVARGLASGPPAAQEPASKELATRELASRTRSSLGVEVEGSATIHDLPRRVAGSGQRTRGDLRR